MTDNEIIKALECCGVKHDCSKCSYLKDATIHCVNAIIKDAIDLIERQKAEIERLNRCNWHISNDLSEEINRNIRLQAEIEELLVELKRFKKIKTTVNEFWSELQKITTFKKKSKPTLEELLEYMKNLKVEAIKEYIEKLKSKAYLSDGVTGFQEMVVDVRDIDETYKEMVGDTE